MHKNLYNRIKTLVLMFLCFVASSPIAAQNITVASAQGQNINSFVQSNLVGGGVLVYNVKFNNATGNITTPQIGTFNANGYTLLRMTDGVLMTTGNINVAPGPNNSGSQSQSVTGYYSDQQMSSVASGTINGCSTLDFDFVSISPFITVNYCFGSEEYPEYVCSNFNDVFAFFITGPDPVTNQTRTWNMAKIPGTATAANPDGIAVAVNSVNQGVAPSSSGTNCYYNYSQYYVINHQPGANGGPNNAQGVQYDGFTQKLSASANVVPCEQYHMHISICNVGDNSYDSGVFLEMNSFNSPSARINLSNDGVDTVVNGTTKIMPLSVADNEYYSYGLTDISFGGTAVNGEDYYCIDSGGDTLSIFNHVVNISNPGHHLKIYVPYRYNFTEPKTIELAMVTSLCQSHPEMNTRDTLRLIIVGEDMVRLRDTVIRCEDTCREVAVEVEYATRPLTFRWVPQTGIDFPTRQRSSACIYTTSQYHVIATDDLGHRDTATVDIIIENEGDDPGDDPGQEGINNNDNNALRIYPNPADEHLTIEASGLKRAELYSANGQLVLAADGNDRLTLDTSKLAAGIYTLRAFTASGQYSRKLITAENQYSRTVIIE
ncbi:MAG: T9SS type A sorting domain-containing protein [Bacteroidales bacterium]|nr:T9SS type A sorting domain-containing protein [Bacteroidales bacterium]